MRVEAGMPDLVTLGPWLRRFLCEHIVTERNLARNTRNSYRDTFSLLLPFVSRKLRKAVDRLAVCDLTSRRVLQFLTHLEEERGCSARTRNQRLAAIRAFARFVGSRDPAHVEWCGHIRAIASKKSMPPPVGWLTRAEMEAMLAGPDRKTERGRSEYALLLFLYNTGARVSEAKQLKVATYKSGVAAAGTISSPCTARAARRANARFGRKLNAFWPIRSSVAPPMTLSSSAGSESRLPASGSIGSSNVARLARRNWPAER
jgi:integrase/recombinase XerD